MRTLDLAILAVYLVGVTVFGCSFYFRKSAKGTAGFVAGGGPGFKSNVDNVGRKAYDVARSRYPFN